MGHVIAVSGKGGVGKTTLCGLLIQYLCESGKRPVLAVDADANANLNEVLGVEPEVTLGLYASGIGAGAYVYLRRIFESLLEQAKGKAGDAIDIKAFNNAHVGEKITMLSGGSDFYLDG